MRHILRLSFVLTLIAPFLFVVTVAPVSACSSETLKFVYEPNQRGTTAGNMGVLFLEGNSVDSSCGDSNGAAHTVFEDLSGDTATTYIEVGYRDTYTGVNQPVLLWNYELNGMGEVHKQCPPDALQSGLCPTFSAGGSLSFNVTPVSGLSTYWKWQFAAGDSETGWTTMGTTPNLGQYKGFAEGEVSKYGTSAAWHDEYYLKYRSTSGGWYNWTNLACDNWLYNYDTMTDWDVIKVSANEWITQHQSPPPGDC
jgi:hypothetical protein